MLLIRVVTFCVDPDLRGIAAAGAFRGILGGASANERVSYFITRNKYNPTARSQTDVNPPVFFAIEVNLCIASLVEEKCSIIRETKIVPISFYRNEPISVNQDYLIFVMNPICVVSGCSRGIGRCIATTLATQGYSLGLMSRDQMALKSLKTELDTRRISNSQQFVVCPCDIRNENDIQ